MALSYITGLGFEAVHRGCRSALGRRGSNRPGCRDSYYLPELPTYGSPVSVNAMLGHFSGMGDYDLIAGSYEGPMAEDAIDLRSVAGGPFRLGNEDYLTIDEFYAVVQKVPLAVKPETSFRYSNLAYFLLAMLD